ncbi:hypothetical protein QQS21_000866 [Conoideocrella luteorostrata]|uniref:C2H2-type domain-containing protein n=1 Tax=Conoideocrella luteorostrata TaxID=1105319 RepID=A0AAJ0CY58_9HYPO|nr:hypothetical protein QQS21_000866 [Conoideocrella luteorostrata]
MEPGVFPCRTCDVSLASSIAWREHAKTESHVSKLRHRVASSGAVLPSSAARRDEWGGADAKPGQKSSDRQPKSPDNESDDSDASEDAVSDPGDSEKPEFFPDQCLFCGTLNGTFEDNLKHMSQSHSFAIPQRNNLIIDLGTLIWYLHLVIYGYQECLLCGKTRKSVEGIQQHMMAKAHCRFDIAGDFQDFYEVSNDVQRAEDIFTPGESTMKLASGKTLGHRSKPVEGPSRRSGSRPDSPGPSPMLTYESNEPVARTGSELMTRNDRTLARLATQLSQFRAGDQQSLAHLPAYELRSVLASRMQQLSTAKRMERRMRSRVESRNNKNLMKHFKIDVPGRSNG